MDSPPCRPHVTPSSTCFLRAASGSASFLQTPAWGAVKSEWRRESLGWFDADGSRLVGAGLVLYRQLPKVQRYLAYLPEGPVIDWDADDLRRLAGPDGRAPQAARAPSASGWARRS